MRGAVLGADPPKRPWCEYCGAPLGAIQLVQDDGTMRLAGTFCLAGCYQNADVSLPLSNGAKPVGTLRVD